MEVLKMRDGDICQVAHVVKDLNATMKYLWEAFGIGPWDIFYMAPPQLRESMVRGKPSDHTYLAACTTVGVIQLELMQPLTGRSIYDEFLEKKGEGLHHIKLFFHDCQKALVEYKKKGVNVIQSGKIEEDEFYYLDTEKNLGITYEIGNWGKVSNVYKKFPN
jgi:methylmalonyl-CoA/ethylmalonyl-CoA epimerase